MPVNTRYINSTWGTSGGVFVPCLIFTRMPGESNLRWLRSLLFVWRLSTTNSLVCWLYGHSGPHSASDCASKISVKRDNFPRKQNEGQTLADKKGLTLADTELFLIKKLSLILEQTHIHVLCMVWYSQNKIYKHTKTKQKERHLYQRQIGHQIPFLQRKWVKDEIKNLSIFQAKFNITTTSNLSFDLHFSSTPMYKPHTRWKQSISGHFPKAWQMHHFSSFEWTAESTPYPQSLIIPLSAVLFVFSILMYIV